MIQIKAVLKSGTIYMGEILSCTGEGLFEDIQIKIRCFSIPVPNTEVVDIEEVGLVTFVKVKDCKKIVIRNKEARHDPNNEGQDTSD